MGGSLVEGPAIEMEETAPDRGAPGSPDPRRDERRGLITATTGNHGQSIAMACQREAIPCTIVVPRGNNPEKNAAMRAFGATLLEVGRDFDEAREHAEALQRERGLRYIHSA